MKLEQKPEPAFRPGARGIAVRELQEAIGTLRPDGVFGTKTRDAVAELQRRTGQDPTGEAGPAVFEAAGIPWPDAFLRCLTLTNAFEGTGFGDCNTADIDGAGLTFGIIGFTTRHGEVHEILSAFLHDVPDALASAAPPLRRELARLLQAQAQAGVEAWEGVLLNSRRRARRETAAALAAWGTHPAMRRLQVEMARKRCWNPAVRAARALGIASMAGQGLLFDTWVQNGGWRAEHARLLEDGASRGSSPGLRMEAVAGAVAAAANPRWRRDVLARKLVFARGSGIVHSTRFTLAAQAFD